VSDRTNQLERQLDELAERGLQATRRGLGSPTLFAIVYTSVASAIYFSLGVVAGHALGLTPFVFLAAGLYFVLNAMTYVEGASLHQERAGSTVFARYAFNELVSFIAGWAVLLDFLILVAVTTFSAANYLGAFWHRLGESGVQIAVCAGIIAYVAVRNVRGFSAWRARRILALVLLDVGLQAFLVILGLALLFDPGAVTDQINLGTAPTWSDVIFALTLASVAFTSLESAAGLAGEIDVRGRGLRRLVFSASATVTLVYFGIGLVAVMALPAAQLGKQPDVEAPMLSVVAQFDPHWLGQALKYVVAAAAAATLIAAAQSAMLGLSRLAYSLATNRQIPSAMGRLHPTRSTPYVVIAIAAVLAFVLVLPEDLDFLVGIYAFGALLAFTIAHFSVIRSRYLEPDRRRPYRMPFNVRVGGASLPIPAVLGAIVSLASWVSVIVLHSGARYVGFGWMALGLALYLVYRTTQDKPVLMRVTVPEAALREEVREAEYGSILVPIFGNALDDDIIQTAGRLAAEEATDEAAGEGATIEALWVFEVPMALPIDARLPDAQLERARAALRRAKAVGEEYEGVEVATATVRARRAGQAIVEEARRRGVEAIVLAAEEPSRIRGGALLGGRTPLDNFVGDVTKYVVQKAPCRVILTAPPASEDAPAPAGGADGAPATTGVTPVR
jgi:basic amino acid/polyamine antiporter, APA family